MARVQLVLPDEDRDRFVHAARREGVSLSEWLRAAARERIERQTYRKFANEDEVAAFFAACDRAEGQGREPDWPDHLAAIDRSRGKGASAN